MEDAKTYDACVLSGTVAAGGEALVTVSLPPGTTVRRPLRVTPILGHDCDGCEPRANPASVTLSEKYRSATFGVTCDRPCNCGVTFENNGSGVRDHGGFTLAFVARGDQPVFPSPPARAEQRPVDVKPVSLRVDDLVEIMRQADRPAPAAVVDEALGDVPPRFVVPMPLLAPTDRQLAALGIDVDAEREKLAAEIAAAAGVPPAIVTFPDTPATAAVAPVAPVAPVAAEPPKLVFEPPVVDVEPDRPSFRGVCTVTLRCATPDAVIWFTTDGSVPLREGSRRYDGPFPVRQNVLVRAVAFVGDRGGPVAERRYLRHG